MPRPNPKKARDLYRSLQSAWGFALTMEPPNWKTMEQIEPRLQHLEAQGFDRPADPDHDHDLEVE
jgi:hypothetical protein